VSLDLQKYLSLFVAEAGEHLAGFGRDLVQLEEAARAGGGAGAREAIDSCFRHAHSVKGMSASMQLEGISALAHAAEDLVDVFRQDPARLDAAAIDLLLSAGDVLQDLVAEAAGGKNPPGDRPTMERLSAAARALRAGGRAPGRDAAPAARQPAADPEAPRRESPPAAARARRRVQVEVEIAGSCPVPAVRAFLVVKKLGALGTVARATPAVDELKAGRIPSKKLEVILETAESLQVLERALSQISDLAAVGLREQEEGRPAEPEPLPAPASVREAERALEASRTVRVRTEILDGFLDAVGELILATARIREVGKGLPEGARGPLDEGVGRLHAIVKDLHDKVMTVRMTPLATVTDRLPRAARDVARKVGKQVEVEVKGAEIELDRAILEELSDPLLHVVRNAVDHGIEPPHLRLLAGKPATGRLSLTARRDRDRVIVEIADDGRGMDPAKLRAAAVARGALGAEQAAALGEREALLLACLPGVSTADAVTDVSGRGVGLDAVKRSVEAVGGTIELESVPGAGSRVTFRLPLTVALQPVLLVRVGEEVLGLPIAKVHGAAQVEMSRLDRSRGAPVLAYDGELVPVHELNRLLGLPGESRDERSVVVAEASEGRIGLAVDALLGQQEAVLKPLGSPLDAVPGLSAVTVLGNGLPVFILDVQRLLAA
jgi:two-component system chemotaxis sensor kinase CheA